MSRVGVVPSLTRTRAKRGLTVDTGAKSGSGRFGCFGRITRFYEKVVKVKADVAAFLNFFSRSTPQIEADPLDAAPVVPIGGDAQGGFQRSALKPLLRGEPRHRCEPALFAGSHRASGVGGTRPPRLSPGGGNGKGGD
jgi:hypothetical protein